MSARLDALDNPSYLRGLLDEFAHPVRVEKGNEVHAEGAIGQVPRPTEQASEGVGIDALSCGSDHAQPAGFGDRTGKLRRRGCSHPRLLRLSLVASILAALSNGGEVVCYRGATPFADVTGAIEALSMWAEQGVALVKKVQPAAEIARELTTAPTPSCAD